MPIDYTQIPSPCFVLDEDKLVRNLNLIRQVSNEADIEIILAFKGFAMWSVFPLIRPYVAGATASSLNEVLLCHEKMGTKAHTYAVAYTDQEFDEILKHSSHVTFNSLTQYERFKDKAIGRVSCGLRVNPGWSDVTTDLYNPASSNSRLGILSQAFPTELPEGIEGLHFHVLCESDSHSLEKVLDHFENRFGRYLDQIKWVNMGGGHLMTREGYNTEHLISLLKAFKQKYDVNVILEPGSAFAWQTGDLVTRVLDIVDNGEARTAIIDASFTCHMPDTLEMPYRPSVLGASSNANEYNYRYRLGGVSCLAGDFLEEYSFEKELSVGDIVVFEDMMHYTMVKTTMFNGVNHPSIGVWKKDRYHLIRKFDFLDFKNGLS